MRIIESALKKSAEERERLLEVWELLGNPSRTVFMDIETTGFSRTYDTVYLIGLAFYRGGEFRVRQYLAAAEADEAKVLKSAVEDMMDFDTVVTYNGDMFDLPFIRERAKRMRVWTDEMQRWDMHVDSIDLLRRYRRYQSFFGWPNLKLKTVEACLGISRQDPFDGGQLIEVFYEYTRTDDERLESVLLLHNYEDIVNLLELLKAETMMGEIKRGHAVEVSLSKNRLHVEWDRRFSISHEGEIPLGKAGSGPKAREDAPKAKILMEAGAASFDILLPLCQNILYYFLPNPEDYYFIPEANEIVHKSLAQDVKPSERRKAKAEECRLTVQVSEGDALVWALPLAGLRMYKPEVKSPLCGAKLSELGQALNDKSIEEADAYIRTYLDRL